MFKKTGQSHDYLTRTGSQSLRIHRARGALDTPRTIDVNELIGATRGELESRRLEILAEMDACDRVIVALGGTVAALRASNKAAKRIPPDKFQELKRAQHRRVRCQEMLGAVNRLIRRHKHFDDSDAFAEAVRRTVTPGQFEQIKRLKDEIVAGIARAKSRAIGP